LYAEKWKEWQLGGDCKREGSQIIVNGDTVSILLDKFGVELRENEKKDRRVDSNTCSIRVMIEPIPGYSVTGFRQLFQGSIIKSIDSMASLKIRYLIRHLDKTVLPYEWKKGKRIQPEDDASIITINYDDTWKEDTCGKPIYFTLQMIFSAKRENLKDYVIGSLDTVDTDFIRKIRLQPKLSPCRSR